ncbi:MAG: ABC transporter ATP-binding protein [Christensenellaceae bacterium]|jgi:putative ABC transport system ATP-binding protein|nr:ABC transporter ATP-binding protein [Christensenellaceae bacterium]
MLKAVGISKSFNKQLVINNVSMNFENNKFYSIVGASGSGKSTLLYLLSGLEKADSGHVEYDELNYDIANDSQLSKLRLEQFGFIFQFHNLIPNITVRDNLMYQQFMRGKKKNLIVDDLAQISSRLGISDKLDKFPSVLSGGEQQRVSIARALLNQPNILFADEPTGNLDSKTSFTVINLILDLQKEFKFTLIMVTHNNSIAEIADVQIKITDGQIAKLN